MFSIILFISGFLAYYIPYIMYCHTLDFLLMFMYFVLVAMVNLGAGALYEYIITKDNDFIKNKSLKLLSFGIALNGFITALMFSINPFLSIFMFFFLMLLNIFKFKKISQDITEEWNEHYDYLKKVSSIKNRKRKKEICHYYEIFTIWSNFFRGINNCFGSNKDYF